MVKVELRRGNRLYLNDGVHGGLAELRMHGTDAPMRVWRINGSAQPLASPLDDFSFYGADDAGDMLSGPFCLTGRYPHGRLYRDRPDGRVRHEPAFGFRRFPFGGIRDSQRSGFSGLIRRMQEKIFLGHSALGFHRVAYT